MFNKPQVLECTLRDGSYAIDFQFTENDTRNITRRLDALGFELIEVGHGIGLGASRNGHDVAAATDEQYMKAAAESVTQASWGMFCIPGIAHLRDLEIAKEYGIDFIRIGCEVDKVADAIDFISYAKKNGIYVFSNLMKSYTSDPTYFAEQATICIAAGADCVYIVDSAGGMLPKELDQYSEAVWSMDSDAVLGFHGHNNLGMAVANSLHCLDQGFAVADSSLQGFGRSSGNAPTEQLVSAMMRSGYAIEMDVVDIMQAGEDFIRPLIRNSGIDSLDTTSGLALFHSSYMNRVIEVAKLYNVDPRRLIIELCNHDRINAPQELIISCAETVAETYGSDFLPKIRIYHGEEQA